jgi:FkbM family methyltransferase
MKILHDVIRPAIKTTFPFVWQQALEWRSRQAERHHWEQRIEEVIACPDNVNLPRVQDAGKIVDGYQIMHNGLKVTVDGYYGDGITRMLKKNRGCHEPQEELVFQAVLSRLPEAAVMVECGAYWAFYSMWFGQALPQTQMFLIEPEAQNLQIGQQNFAMNGYVGNFTHAYIGDKPGVAADGIEIVQIDDFFARHHLDYVHILHSDIQGYEMELLHGAVQTLATRRVRYYFISTHSEELHEQCVAFLKEYDYAVDVSISPAQSYSMDGILVARDPQVDATVLPHPSRKPVA